MPLHPNTLALHTGEGALDSAKPLNRPIYASSTFVFDRAADVEAYQQGDKNRYLYSRHANPTVEAAEARLAALEGAEAALVTSSGMAAVATVFFGLLAAGDELVCSAGVYGATLKLATSLLRRFGVDVRVVSLDELADPASVMSIRHPSSENFFIGETPQCKRLVRTDSGRQEGRIMAQGEAARKRLPPPP